MTIASLRNWTPRYTTGEGGSDIPAFPVSTTETRAIPSGTAVGDTLILVAHGSTASGTINASTAISHSGSGWTLLFHDSVQDTTSSFGGISVAAHLAVWWKIAGPSEPSVTVTFGSAFVFDGVGFIAGTYPNYTAITVGDQPRGHRTRLLAIEGIGFGPQNIRSIAAHIGAPQALLGPIPAEDLKIGIMAAPGLSGCTFTNDQGSPVPVFLRDSGGYAGAAGGINYIDQSAYASEVFFDPSPFTSGSWGAAKANPSYPNLDYLIMVLFTIPSAPPPVTTFRGWRPRNRASVGPNRAGWQ